MTAEQALAAFSPTGIFGLTWLEIDQRWRVYYRCEFHYDNPSRREGCDYRFAGGDSVIEAIANVITQQVKERLT